MMKLDILFGGWLKAPNGAASVVRSLQENANSFHKNDVNVEFFSLDNIHPRQFDHIGSNEHAVKFSIKKNIKNIVKKYVNKFAKQNILLAKKNITRGMCFSKEVAIHYINKANGESSVLIHDLFTCYYYLKNRTIYQPTFLVLHNSGDTFSMLLEYYPCLEDSKFLKYLIEIEHYVLTNVDKLIFVAEKPMELFLNLHPYYDPNKVTFIHNGIVNKQHSREKEFDEKYELVCVGSISTRKGQDLIIDALNSMKLNEREKLHVTIVGDGPLRINLEEKSKELGLPISFVGFSNEIEKYLLKSDIFLLPSRDEGFPISILEAERASLPIISTKVAGIPEMVKDGANGILIQPNVKQLEYILKNISMYDWQKMGIESRKIFEEKFTIEKMISNYSRIVKA